MKYLGSLFKCRARRSICVNASKTIYYLWTIMKVFVNEGVKVKFSITDSHTHDDLLSMAHPSQLETQYGGTAKTLDSYWPPCFPSHDYGVDTENLKL